jgi:uncharacterized protein YndB with AHSA1/START domain
MKQPRPAEAIELDLRVGGAWRQRMVIDESTNYVTGGIYREIVPGEKLVFAWGADGGWPALDPDRLDDSPTVTVILDHSGRQTEMTVHVELPAAFVGQEMPEGWFSHIESGMRDTVDRLAREIEQRPMLRTG